MKEGSVAPKERVNIVYKPATGDAREEVELPLRLLLVGDFTLKEDERRIEEREPIAIDKDNFSEVMKAQDLELSLNVPNKLSGKEDDPLNLHLQVNGLADFEPDQIVKKVPELAKLMELREALKALKGPLGNIPDFRKKVQQLVTDEGARQRLLKELGIES